MITTPRCGQPMRTYTPSRAADALDPPGLPDPFPVCWRPKGHPGERHASEASYKRMLAQAVRRKRNWRRARRRANDGPG